MVRGRFCVKRCGSLTPPLARRISDPRKFCSSPKKTFSTLSGVKRIRLGRHPHGGAHRERKKSTGKRILFSGSRLRKQKDPDQQTCCKCPEAQCASSHNAHEGTEGQQDLIGSIG